MSNSIKIDRLQLHVTIDYTPLHLISRLFKAINFTEEPSNARLVMSRKGGSDLIAQFLDDFQLTLVDEGG